MDSEFNRLVDSLTKQQQRRSDLEIAIKKADARKKTLDGELAATQRKEETIMRQIPETKKDISYQNAVYTSHQADLRQLQNGCVKLQENLDAARRKVEQLQELHLKDNVRNDEFSIDVTAKLNNNLGSITRALETVKNQ